MMRAVAVREEHQTGRTYVLVKMDDGSYAVLEQLFRGEELRDAQLLFMGDHEPASQKQTGRRA